MLRINGEDVDFAGKSIHEYLKLAGYDEKNVAVLAGEEVVRKADYEKTILKDGDTVEVVSFMGGG